MKSLIIWFFYLLSATINAIPQRLRYIFSDFLAFLVQYILRYRRKVVRNNLKNSYPDKSSNEIRQIERQFYKNFADFFVEVLQLLTMKGDYLKKRIILENKELIDNILLEGKSAFVAIGHSGNWEWFGVYLALTYPGKFSSLYKEQRNKVFDTLIYRMRTRLGHGNMLESKSAFKKLASNKRVFNLVIIPGDQTPGGKATDHWTVFMNQDTPFFNGLEKMACSLGYEVLFADVHRVKRGFYRASIEKLFPGEIKCRPGLITEAYARRLEQALMQRPDNWLWSHRRWKHKRNISA